MSYVILMVKSHLMLIRLIKGILWAVSILLSITVCIFMLPRVISGIYSWSKITDVHNAPRRDVAIVFGAGLWWDGSPTPVLRDRIETAAKLYFSGKVKKLLMSGDNRFQNYNEPGAMQAYAIELGIPEKDIVLDYAGQRTYDTCYRAREIFKISEVLLVTQLFHLPRALYTCNKLGINAIGVPANNHQYRKGSTIFWNLRELPATFVALWQVHFSHPVPILGESEPISWEGLENGTI